MASEKITVDRETLLRDLLQGRKDKIAWKDLSKRFGLSVERLKQLHGDATNRPDTECPNCHCRFRRGKNPGKKTGSTHRDAGEEARTEPYVGGQSS